MRRAALRTSSQTRLKVAVAVGARPVAGSQVQRNLAAYETQLQRAKQRNPGVEIVVFPEGANGWFPSKRFNRKTAPLFGDALPYVMNGLPQYYPCNDLARKTGQLRQLSRLAKKYSVYLVADMIEVRDCAPKAGFVIGDPPCAFPDKKLMFNTLVALGPDGRLLATCGPSLTPRVHCGTPPVLRCALFPSCHRALLTSILRLSA